jgi:hypothetical protein
MNIKTSQAYPLEQLSKVLKNQFGQYKIYIEKNPVFGFEYLVVKKSGLIAAIVRSKNDKVMVYAGIPSALVRFVFFLSVILLGVLIPIIIYYSISGKIVSEIGNSLRNAIQSGQNLNDYSSNFVSGEQQSINQQPSNSPSIEIPPVVKWTSIAGIVLFGIFVLRTFINFPIYYLSESMVLIPLLINVFGIIALILSMTGKKAGFFIFIFVVILKILFPLAMIGTMGIFGIGYLFLLLELAIVGILAANYKYLH